MDLVRLNLEKRDAVGKEVCGRLRRSGYIPAVFYGPDYKEAMSVQVKAEDFLPNIRGTHWNTLKFDAVLPDGSSEMCIIRDMSRNYVSDDVLHVDFYQLVKGHKVSVKVPIEIVGKEACAGVKAGGVLEHRVLDIEINVLPRDIPENVVLNVESMNVGDSVTLADLDLPESAEMDKDPSEIVVEVVHGKGASSEEVSEEEESAEEMA
ncbi:50S ribosomal protein L25 [Dethiosulfovibrio sp. F2B]|uniref:50S ribosomal protein L25 n=1 Tax=Dethiosulfovibrio faecalis TaxID=2720018 RepID=UPI001F43BE8E|nr:50S ribosomal protein L25 [Dethiosulfovibrio faecalis]MCF4152088.1 50S ribosomal protein L25 [Dethiosulfovibrio faecalis]